MQSDASPYTRAWVNLETKYFKSSIVFLSFLSLFLVTPQTQAMFIYFEVT